MEETRKVALAWYANGSNEWKQEAESHFSRIDSNGDGRVSKLEFTQFLKEMNMHHLLNKEKLFAELDRNGDGYLDFEEAIVFFYMARFDRFWCDNCGQLIKTVYFTCYDCFFNLTCYDLCVDCYGSMCFDHEHTSFVDSQFMLIELREKMQEQLSENNSNQYSPSSTDRGDGGTSDSQLQKLVVALQQASCSIM